MLSTPEFWVFIAFVLLLGLVGKRALAFLNHAITEHQQKITNQLAEAERLHDEALSLLNTYKKKYQEATKQAEKIISFAEQEALEFKKLNQREFEKFLAQKEKAILERIAIETEETKSMLRKQITEEGIKMVEQQFLKQKKETKNITKAALKEITNSASTLLSLKSTPNAKNN